VPTVPFGHDWFVATRDLVVIGASAGGIEALRGVLGGLPADFPAAVLVVVHGPATGSALAEIAARFGPLPAATAEDGMALKPGHVIVGRGDHHLLVEDGMVLVRKGPRENGHRPAIDPLFRSAARWHGPSVVGVVLSGNLDDGTAGLSAIRRQGGVAVVQDPDDALFDGMPRNALAVEPEHVVPADEIGALLDRLARDAVRDHGPSPDRDMIDEVALMAEGDQVLEGRHPGDPSPWSCPDCGGVLWAIDDGPNVRFRCRVGHAWAAGSLAERKRQDVESALWVALRALEDRVALCKKMAERADEGRNPLSADRFRQDAHELGPSIEQLRRLLGEGIPNGET
jgi:two-component system chemotaxis response regulator CheB